MQHYENVSRGTFQNEENAKQLVSFEGMRYVGHYGLNNVSPTDIDGYIQLDDNNIFIFFELKYSGAPPGGQRHAYEELVDGLAKGGKNSILFVAQHHTQGIIVAKNAIVVKVYWRGRWSEAKKGYALGKAIDLYISYIAEHGRKEGR